MTPENTYIYFITQAIISYDLATINREGAKKRFTFDIFNHPNGVIFVPNNTFFVSNFVLFLSCKIEYRAKEQYYNMTRSYSLSE